ncbi:MAG: hypothetical protein ACF8CQ_09810 [Rhodopirellula sp. JB044]
MLPVKLATERPSPAAQYTPAPNPTPTQEIANPPNRPDQPITPAG